MAIIKCKMCGGDLEISAGKTVAECEYCGTKQTLPKVNDEVIQNLFNRANNLRIKCEFDKAEQIYEKILQENDAEAEAHWGIVLCKYGIEYVEDPKTFKRIPTCHRTSYDAVTADAEYLAAVQHADALQRGIYEAEAKAIDLIQKNILNIVKNEKPFDVFICYKETDESGKRTVDSTIANDIYYQLTPEGLKVFYAAITLEDKLGQEYEPYIFAALNSAKVMLVIGTKPQHFTAVWVKNEWSRFLKLMKTDRSKLLIPCYKDMDAYDLPEEVAHLQAQDMGKIGFINDVVRGIKKVTVKDEPAATVVKETVVTGGNTNTAPLLMRAFMFLEDGDWSSANEYCEKVLDLDPECAEAYLGKLMAELQVKNQEGLKDCAEIFDYSGNYQKTVRFADEKLKAELADYIEHINTRNENTRLESAYTQAIKAMNNAKDESEYKSAANMFEQISAYKDSKEFARKCLDKAEVARKDSIYNRACVVFNDSHTWHGKQTDVKAHEEAIELFKSIYGWRDADEKILACQKKIEEIKAKAEADRLEKERQAEIARKEAERIAKRNKKIAIIAASIVCAVIVFIIILNTVIIPSINYNNAVALMEAKSYAEAAIAFGQVGDIKDAKAQADRLWDAVTERENVSAGWDYTVGLKADGTVVAVGRTSGGKFDVFSSWNNIVAISAGNHHTVGLKADGTVVAVGSNIEGQCNVSGWKDIVAISAYDHHTVGLKADGTVVAVGYNDDGQCDVSGWKDIVAISAGWNHTVGLKADGTVVAVGDNDDGECDVSGWKDIVAISAGSRYTVGLKADGTVVAVGENHYGQCEVSGWKDIVAISASWDHTVGLKADGTVVAVGDNDYGRCEVSAWKDIVAISASWDHTVGLKADGTVVAVGSNSDGECNVSGWKDIKTD